MLSFFSRSRSESASKVDVRTDGSSAHVYRGGSAAQIPKDTVRLRVAPSAKHLDGRVDYGRLFSMELPKHALSMDVNLTQGTSCLPPSRIVQAVSVMISDAKSKDVFKGEHLKFLRNVAFPPDLPEKHLPSFDSKSELGRILPSRRNRSLAFSFMCNRYALRGRFEQLPVHGVCYYHSYDPAKVAVRELRHALRETSSGAELDCLGMSPLHILACSTKHRTKMYELLLEAYPEHLITEDEWGDIPLLYACWGRAPQEVVDLLTDKMKELYPGYTVNVQRMVDTLCAAMAPLPCVEYLITTLRDAFEESAAELQSIDWGSFVDTLCTKARASEEHVNEFIEMFQTFCPENNVDLQSTAAEFIRREKFGFHRFWLRIGISSRLESLEKREWREELEAMIENCPVGSTLRDQLARIEVMSSLRWKLEVYEVYGPMWLLELALWKARLEISGGGQGDLTRSQCRVTCGAPIIVPKVAAFLLPETLSVSEIESLIEGVVDRVDQLRAAPPNRERDEFLMEANRIHQALSRDLANAEGRARFGGRGDRI